SGIEYDFVCGIPNAGEPIAEAFRGLLDKGKQYKARLIKRGSGDSRRVSRFRICTRAKAKQTAKRVLLLDDVVSGADSKLEAIEAVKKAGYEIVAIAIAIDREQGGAEYLEKLGYKVFCWKGLSELLSFYYLLGVISWHRRAEVLKYIERTKLTIAPS
ncbi:MAG: phosphoribosyltransferase family protein, partial [Candidatus Spechtbacterales bacterium]